MTTQPQELGGTGRLRSNTLPRESLVLLRGGPEPVTDLLEQAENSGRRYMLDGKPFYALSLAAVLEGTTEDELLASRPLKGFASYYRMTAGQLSDAGYTVWATFTRENHYDVRLPSADPQAIRDFPSSPVRCTTIGTTRVEGRLAVTSPVRIPEVDIRADLQNEDETGYAWSYLDRATHPERIVDGATVIAGSGGGRCLARVADIVDGPGGRIVHLELLDGSVTEFEHARRVRRAS